MKRHLDGQQRPKRCTNRGWSKVINFKVSNYVEKNTRPCFPGSSDSKACKTWSDTTLSKASLRTWSGMAIQ